MQQLPNTKYEIIGYIISHLKEILSPFTDDMKIDAVELLEELSDDDINYIFLTKDVNWLLLCMGFVFSDEDSVEEDEF